jgi:hypothetical protein
MNRPVVGKHPTVSITSHCQKNSNLKSFKNYFLKSISLVFTFNKGMKHLEIEYRQNAAKTL